MSSTVPPWAPSPDEQRAVDLEVLVGVPIVAPTTAPKEPIGACPALSD